MSANLKNLISEYASATVPMVFVAIRDGAIYGAWTSPSAEATHVMALDHPDVAAFLDPTPDYRALRRGDYPAVGDQLDVIWRNDPAELATMRAVIAAVKAKHPKPA